MTPTVHPSQGPVPFRQDVRPDPEPLDTFFNLFDGEEITVRAVDGQIVLVTRTGELHAEANVTLRPQGDREAWRLQRGF